MTQSRPATSHEPPFSVREPFFIGYDGVTRVLMVRHGQQKYPEPGDFVHDEWLDPPLSALGQVQAHAVAAALGEEPIDVVICSSMSRARDTATMIASSHELVPVIDDELREVETFRDLEPGAKPAEIMDPAEWSSRQEHFRIHRRWDDLPYGETSAEFHARINAAMDRILSEHRGKTIVIVSHGGTINAFFAHLLGIDEDLFFLPKHCSLSTAVEYEGMRRLVSINEHRYLHAGILTD